MGQTTMRTYVYVDGFNLYYEALRGTAWKWLDLPALFATILQPLVHHLRGHDPATKSPCKDSRSLDRW